MIGRVTLTAAVALLAAGVASATTPRAKAPAHKASVIRAVKLAIGIGNPPGCVDGQNPSRTLAAYHATVLHEVIDPRHNPAQLVPCFAAAKAHGYRVSIAIQYWNGWSIKQDVAYFRRTVKAVAPYAWAISVGNEQDISTGGLPSPRKYVATWRAVEPIVAGLAPHAIRVAGEISPWGESFLKAAWKAGLPGAQVVSAHPYNVRYHFRIPDLVRWAASIRKPLWFTEGMRAAHAWGATVPRTQFKGVALGVAWLTNAT